MTNSAVEKAKDQALAKKPTLSIQDLIQKSAQELGKALPSHMRPERIVRIALTTLRMNPKLYQCNPYSFLGALFQCAQLGLEPNIEGQAYIIPYNDRKSNQLVAQFQIGYKGFVELFWRHQSAVSLQMEKVCQNDRFEYDLGENKIHHVPPQFGQDRGDVIGYYAVAQLAGGGRAIKVMSKTEAVAFGKRFSKCYDRKEEKFMYGTPWADHFDAMAQKTVLKQLMKLLPKSIEIQRALAMDETVKTRIDADMVEVPAEEVDHSPEEETPPVNGGPAEAHQSSAPVPTKDEVFGPEIGQD